MKVNVKFDFLGNRNYIHSTSWLYKLLEILKENGYIKQNNEINKINAVFREKKDKQGYYLIDEEYKGADILFDINLDKIGDSCYNEDGKYNFLKMFTASKEELKELGFSDTEIANYKKISIYDEILINPDLNKVEE